MQPSFFNNKQIDYRMSEQDVKPNNGFFSISKEDFLRAWDLGLNPALAYLIIAQGTGGDHKTSKWSANAVNKYIGIDWKIAKKAVDKLIENGLMSNFSENSHPRYKLHLSDKSKMIWLPKIIMDGTNNKASAIKRLKERRDPALTRMFVLLYSHQFMPKYGGVNHELLWRNCELHHTKGLEGMDWNCWTYEKGSITAKDLELAYELTGEEFDQSLLQRRFWDRLESLEKMGLLEEVIYAIDEDEQIMFPLEGRHEHERRVKEATFQYFEQLYIDNDMEWRDDFPDFTTPHYQSEVSVKGVFRMRLEANTETNGNFFKAMYAKVASYCDARDVGFL